MPLKINVETIPHNCQRYETVGDWTFEPDGTLNVNVSEMFAVERFMQDIMIGGSYTNPRQVEYAVKRVEQEDSEFLVAIHEVIEAWLCKKAGITAEQVDEFDMNYAKQPDFDLRTECKEPGDDPRAPYHVQHLIAQSIEMMLCAQLGIKWEDHCKAVEEVR